jgi:CBS domain-containing protein
VEVSKILPAARDLVSIGDDTNIEQTMNLLADNKILSVPVIKSGLLRGFVDIYEIMSYTAFSGNAPVDWRKPASSLLGTMGNIQDDEEKGVWVVREKDSLHKPLSWLSKGARRFLAETESGDLKLVTQSDMARFLWKNYDRFGIGDVSLQNASIIGRPVIRVEPSTLVIDAFQKMRAQEVNGIAITGRDGSLVGTLSESDLKGLRMNMMDRLQLPVLDFLKAQHQGVVPPVVTVREDMPLKDVLETITKKKLHRMFVVDDEGHLTGIITLTDIISYFWKLTMGYWFSTE